MLKKTFVYAFDLMLIGAIFLLIYNGFLVDHPLFNPDEGRYSEISREMLQSGDLITPYLNGLVFLEKPVGYFWLQTLSFKLFGISEWTARLPNLFLALVGVIATYCFSVVWFNRHTARLAALILMGTPFYFGAAHYANLDLSLAIFITLTLNCLITALATTSAKQKAFFCRLAYVFAGCAFLIKGLIALVFPFLMVMCWMIIQRRIRLLLEIHLISGSILFLSVILPWCILMQMRHPQFFDIFFLHEQFGRYLSHADFNNKSPVWFFLPIVFVGVFPWSALLVRALIQSIKSVVHNYKKHAIECLLLIWIVCILVFFSIPKSKLVGYAIPTLPPLAILLAHLFHQHWLDKKTNLLNFSALFLVLTQISLLFLIYFSSYLSIEITQYKMYLYCVIAACMLCSIYLTYPFQFNRMQKLFYSHFLLALFIFAVFLFSIPILQRQSLRDFAQQLKPFLLEHPDAHVIMWNDYVYDLPFYLNRTIKIAGNWRENQFEKDNWQREFTRAANITLNQKILIEEKQMLQEATKSCASHFVIAKKHDADLMKKPFTILFQGDGYFALWNAC